MNQHGVLAITILTLAATVAFPTEVYFSPSPDCENRIVRSIDESKAEILAAVYSINNRKIIDALESAKKRGVKIRILTDYIQATQKNSGVAAMIQAGLDVRVHSKFKLEHNKFGIYDGKLVSTGSFNWTGPASRSNSENCIFLAEAEIAGKYRERFEFLWLKNSAEASKSRISKITNAKSQADRKTSSGE